MGSKSSTKLKRNRKGQLAAETNSNGAAFLILVIMLLVIFYILFLPPEDRANLLEDDVIPGTPGTSSGGYSYLLGTSPLSLAIGHVDYISDAEIEHTLSSFRIYTQTDARVIKDEPSIYVKNSAFETKTKQIDFTLEKEATENVQLAFNVYRSSGVLSIYLNSVLIFEGELNPGSPTPITLDQHLLKDNNVLFLKVSSPGFAFWRVNQYEIQNLRITGDITDDSNSFNMQKFYLADSEFVHAELADLAFFPDCTPGEVGNIQITLNGQGVFYGIPDCGITNHITLDRSQLRTGENRLEFVSESGSYLIDMPKVDVSLEDPEYPIYYFELHEDLFLDGTQTNNFCGKVDGVCPENCQPYDDKDCCFDQSNQNYWCDVQTNNPFDRCVNTVLASYVSNCETVYEDVSGDPHDDAIGTCGDDTDDYCPIGCSEQYDKDCCFENIPGAFWCEDVPFTGLTSTCKLVITPAECDACPEGYYDENNDEPNCPTTPSSSSTSITNPSLKAGVDVVFDVFFVDDEYHKVDFNINGNVLPIDTYSLHVTRNIDLFIREGANSIVVQPRKDVDIAQMRILIQ